MGWARVFERMWRGTKEEQLKLARQRYPQVHSWFWTGEEWFPTCLALPFGGNKTEWLEQNKSNIVEVEVQVPDELKHHQENWLAKLLRDVVTESTKIRKGFKDLVTVVTNQRAQLQNIIDIGNQTLDGTRICCKTVNEKLDNLKDQVNKNSDTLDQILTLVKVLQPPPVPVVVGFKITTTILDSHGLPVSDNKLPDDGSVVYVADPVDVSGNSTSLPSGTVVSWTVSDPILVLAPDPEDASGLTQIGKPTLPSPPPSPLPAGIVAAISADVSGNPIKQAADPVDIVAGSPTAFGVTVSPN